MTFNVARKQVRISFALVPAIAFGIITGAWKNLLFAALSLAVHEAAHGIAAKNAGFRVVALSIYPFGAVMQLDGVTTICDMKWTVAAAGPFASLAFAGLLKLSETAVGGSPAVETLVRMNLAIALLNLLPVFPLDGGRVLKTILIKSLRERAAKTVLLLLTGAFSAIMLIGGVILIIGGRPLWTLPMIAPFLLISAIAEMKVPDAGRIARVMERKEALLRGQAQRTVMITVSDVTTVGEAMTLLSMRCCTVFRVKGERCAKELDENALLEAAAKYGMQTSLKSVIYGLTERD